MSESRQSLTIVIPALDEEAAIGSTVERCLEAREHIREAGSLDRVEVIVVSDGSTDRTEEIAGGYQEVTVLTFEHNRGYGAAIKAGFEHGQGSLVGFLDADGTCDPRVFAELCRAIQEDGADVAIGSRMGPDSEMPRIRAIGNRIFAWMLGILSKRLVGDTASGMRVIRRDRLADLYPLPDGLHFTPAMSARVLIEDRLKLLEVPMSYAERVGRSKLSVVRDGIRFFKVILQASMCFRPARPLLMVAGALALLTVVVIASPVALYLREVRLEEWMIYRVLLASLLITGIGLLLVAAIVAEHISALAYRRAPARGGVTGVLGRLFTPRVRLLGGLALVAASVVVAWPGIVEYLSSGQVFMHWSRAVLAALLLVLAGVLSVTTFLLSMMRLIGAQLAAPATARPPERIRPATRPSSAGGKLRP